MAKFLKELRNSPEPKKRLWLIGSSAAAMAVVVIAWSFYISGSIQDISINKNPDEINAAPIGFWPIVRHGTAIVAGNLFEFLKEKVSTPREINIEKGVFQVEEALPTVEPGEIK